MSTNSSFVEDPQNKEGQSTDFATDTLPAMDVFNSPEALEGALKVVEPLTAAPELGYTPPQLIIAAIDMIHTTAGLPWWACIVASTIGMRVALLPLMAKSIRASVVFPVIRPEMERLSNLMKNNSHNPTEALKYQSQLQELFRKHDANPFKAMLVPIVQIPLFVSFFMGLRQMHDYFPSYASGGTLWFTDLSATDTTYALPVISAVSFLAVVELGTGMKVVEDSKQIMMKNFMRVMSVAMVPLTAMLPQGVFVYWITSNGCSILQSLSFRFASVRSALNIPEAPTMPVQSAAATDGPAKGFMETMQEAVENARNPPPPSTPGPGAHDDSPVATFSYKPRASPKKKAAPVAGTNRQRRTQTNKKS